MKEEIRNILTSLENGEISCKKAVNLIKNISENNIDKVKPANRIKILIIDGDDGTKIRLPAIPFWLVTSLGRFVMLLTPLAAKYSNHMDQHSKTALELINKIDIKELINAIRAYGSFDFVDVCSDKDIVKISVL